MINDYEFEKLQDLRIHELRDLARKIGVRSPTSQKKEALIEKILEIISGESQPYVANTKQGRPAKSQEQINNIVDFFIPPAMKSDEPTAGVYEPTLSANYNFDFIANEPFASYGTDVDYSDLSKASGILEIHENGHGVVHALGEIDNMENVFVHAYSIKAQNLRTGDFISGYIKKLQPDKPFVMVEITEVNYISVNEITQRINFENIAYLSQNKKIKIHATENHLSKIMNQELFEGSRAMILFDNKVDLNYMSEFIRCIDSKYHIFFINLNARPEEQNGNYGNVHFINSCFSKLESEQLELLKLVMEHAKRLVEMNEKVILFLNNLKVYYKCLKTIYGKDTHNLIEHKIKEDLTLAKCGELGSLTLVVLDTKNQEPALKDFVSYELTDLCNVIVIETEVKNNFKLV